MVAAPQCDRVEYDARWSDEDYTAANRGYTPFFLKFMAKGVSEIRVSPIEALDVGCGDGFFSGHLARLGCQVRGIDLSDVGLSTARSNYPDIDFTAHDLAEALPFEDESFDLVWCSEVLEHLFSPLFVIQQIQRVLRPGGMFLATVPHHGLIKNLAIALLRFERHFDPTYPHLRFFTRKSLADLMARAGLRVRHDSTCGCSYGMRDWFVPTNILMVATKPR